MNLAEKLTDKIIGTVLTLSTVSEFEKVFGLNTADAISEIENKVRQDLEQALDETWLSFLNSPEYDRIVKRDGDKLFDATSKGWQLGYIQGWQDRDALVREPLER